MTCQYTDIYPQTYKHIYTLQYTEEFARSKEEDEALIAQLRADLIRLKMVRSDVQPYKEDEREGEDSSMVETYVKQLTLDTITDLVRGNTGPVTGPVNVTSPSDSLSLSFPLTPTSARSGKKRLSAAMSTTTSEGAKLLTTLLDDANQYAYFGGTIDQIKEVAQSALNVRQDLEKRSVSIQNFLDDVVSIAITKRNECRIHIQTWISTFNDLTGRDPNEGDKTSSLHFQNFATDFVNAQRVLSKEVSSLRRMALQVSLSLDLRLN